MQKHIVKYQCKDSLRGGREEFNNYNRAKAWMDKLPECEYRYIETVFNDARVKHIPQPEVRRLHHIHEAA